MEVQYDGIIQEDSEEPLPLEEESEVMVSNICQPPATAPIILQPVLPQSIAKIV